MSAVSRRRRLVLAASSALAAGALAACQLVAGLELPAFVKGDAEAPDAAAEAGPAADPACEPDLPRARPSQPAPDLAQAFTFAAQFIQVPTLIEPDTSRLCPSAAIDLDGFKTCEEVDAGDGRTVRQGNSCLARSEVCDTAGGGDSQLQQVAVVNLGTQPNKGGDPNELLQQGKFGVLVELTSYNGKDDDAQVSVAFIQAVGVTLPDGGRPATDGSGGSKPLFDGTDEWWPDRKSFTTEDRAAYVVQDAYVVGGVLVARFTTRTPFSFGGSGVNLMADEIVLTARLVRDASGLPVRLDQGRLALRVPAESIWTYAAGRLSDGLSVCATDAKSLALRKAVIHDVCSGLDLASGAGAVTPDKACDAISFAAGFYAYRATRVRTGLVTPDAGAFEGCPPDAGWPPNCDDYFDAGN